MFVLSGGQANLGVADQAVVAGAGVVPAVARGSLGRVPKGQCLSCPLFRCACALPKVVAASCLEFAFARKLWGCVSAAARALHAASDAKAVGFCQGRSSGEGGLHRRRLAKHPRLQRGSTEKGVRVRHTWLRFSVVR
jgi:hypothetical protein